MPSNLGSVGIPSYVKVWSIGLLISIILCSSGYILHHYVIWFDEAEWIGALSAVASGVISVVYGFDRLTKSS